MNNYLNNIKNLKNNYINKESEEIMKTNNKNTFDCNYQSKGALNPLQFEGWSGGRQGDLNEQGDGWHGGRQGDLNEQGDGWHGGRQGDLNEQGDGWHAPAPPLKMIMC